MTDWLEELRRLEASVESLPLAARDALVATLDAFAAEDGGLAPAASRTRALLATAQPRAPRPAATAEPESLITALTALLPYRPLPRPARTAA